MGEEVGIETSLRRPCEPAPAPAPVSAEPAPVPAVPAADLLEVSRSFISTGIWDGGCAAFRVDVERGGCCEA